MRNICGQTRLFDDTPFLKGHPLLDIKNLFSCESHTGMLNRLFIMVLEGELPLAQVMKEKIIDLQKMPV